MAELDAAALTGLFGGGDPSQMQQLLAQLQPSEEDRKRARREGLMAFGFQMLANPYKGQEFQALGQAGLLGMNTQRDSLSALTKERGATIAQAAGLQKMAREQMRERRLQEVMDRNAPGGGITPPPLAPPPIGPIGMKPKGPPPPEAPMLPPGPDGMPPGGPPPGAMPPGPPPGMQPPQPPSTGVQPGTPPQSAPPGVGNFLLPPIPAADLMVLASGGEGYAKAAEFLEKSRKTEVTREGLITQGGVLKGRATPNGIEIYEGGDPTKGRFIPMSPGQVQAELEKITATARAQEEAKASNRLVDVKVGRDIIQLPENEAVKLKSLYGRQSPGGAPKINLQDATPEETAQVLQLATSPGPITQAKEIGENETRQHTVRAQAEAGVKRLGEYTSGYQAMRPVLAVVNDLEDMDNRGVFGGATGGAKQVATAWLSSMFGITPESAKKLGFTEAYDAGVSELQKAIAKSFPGAQSDKELEALKRSLPALLLSEEGRQHVRNTLRRKAAHTEKVLGAAESYALHTPSMIGFREPEHDPAPILWKPPERFKLSKGASPATAALFKRARELNSTRDLENLYLQGQIE